MLSITDIPDYWLLVKAQQECDRARDEFSEGFPAFILEGMSIFRSLERRSITGKSNYQWGGGGGVSSSSGSSGSGNNGATASWEYKLVKNAKGAEIYVRKLVIRDKDQQIIKQFNIDINNKPDELTDSEFMMNILNEFQKILDYKPDFFDNVTVKNIVITSKTNIAAEYNKLNNTTYNYMAGFHLYDPQLPIKIYLASELFKEGGDYALQYDAISKYGTYNKNMQGYAAIAHEFGHNIDLNTYGYNVYYNIWSKDMRENSANAQADFFRGHYGDPISKKKP